MKLTLLEIMDILVDKGQISEEIKGKFLSIDDHEELLTTEILEPTDLMVDMMETAGLVHIEQVGLESGIYLVEMK